ncbi:alpha/beta hydrolase [Nocardia veterana]|uniref:Esterase family protein n=1 Tax=Nocardia veterana TaxID=132249 RepID=A0A7X6M107_9NOCA|nr:alpha/beta hydrolase family protein [Nocardia veterana]NKY87764.1 esterase family protein [Nocardia veterana]
MPNLSGRGARWLAAVVVSLLSATAVGAATAAADPVAPVAAQVGLNVYSPAMDRFVPVRVLRPADTSSPRPTLYLLDGVEGGETGSGWLDRTDAAAFFADKNVNVVLVLAGRASYYTDWERDDPALGRNKWATFLTRELPPVIDATFGTTGRNAIAGLSMSALSVLSLAVRAPGVYRAVGSYSGCAQTSDPVAQAYVAMMVARYGANPVNMWGPPADPEWAANDPTLHADSLRGTQVYVSTGTGLPGPHETMADRDVAGNPVALADRIVIGGGFESVVNGCTARLATALQAAGVPAQVVFRPTGTHAWGYWQDALHDSWPMFAAALGA